MANSWNASEAFPLNAPSSSRLPSASTEPSSSLCSSPANGHQRSGRKISSTMTAKSQPSHDLTAGNAAPWTSFLDRTIAASGCQESRAASQDPKASTCQHSSSPSQSNRDWMDFFFSKSNLASLKDSNGSISTAECETCLPTHSHTSTRSSHNLACPSAPIPFETCDNDACSMNHSSVVSALAACCNLPHLTSPIRCTQSLPTACCADAPSQPSCDPCTIHPSCPDVACLDVSCNTHLDAPQCSTEHAPDASAPHPHCVPQCDGQSHGQPHRLMDCHEPHVVIPAGQKNYDDLQQLLDCCYCSDGSFDPCCSEGKHAASGQVTPASADTCLTPTTNCTDGAYCPQSSSHGTSPSTTLTSFDGCRLPFPHRHSDNGGCIPPQATLCNHGTHAACHQHHSHQFHPGSAQPMICSWTDCTQSTQGSHQGQFQRTSSTAGSSALPWALPSTVTPSNRPCDSSLCAENHVNTNRGAHASNGNSPLNVLLNQLLQEHQNSANQSQPQQSPQWNQCGDLSSRKGEMLPPRSYSHSGIDDSISTASSSMSYSASTSRLDSPMTERSVGSTSTVTASSSHHPCGWMGCSEVFATHEDLTEHVADVHVGGGKSKYTCGWVGCQRAKEGKTFQQRQKILRHIQTHTGDRPFKCSVCSRRFSEQNTLSQHMRTHTREKPYVCDFPGCNASFAVAGSLTIHKRSRHTLERPFVCNWPGCGRAFAESSNLTKHRRVHSGEKPFPCKLCDRKFSRPDQLARHMKVHTGHTIDGASSTASSPPGASNNGFASSPGQMTPLVEDASTTGLQHMQLGLAADRTAAANMAIWGGV